MKHTQPLIVTNFVVGDRVRLNRNEVLGLGLMKHFASHGFTFDDVHEIVAIEQLKQNGNFIKGATTQLIKYGDKFYQECCASFLVRVDE